jgi:hypothetical protein
MRLSFFSAIRLHQYSSADQAIPIRAKKRRSKSAVSEQPYPAVRANAKSDEKQPGAFVPRPLQKREELSFLFFDASLIVGEKAHSTDSAPPGPRVKL